MKKLYLIMLILYITLINSAVYAFSNQYFSVKDTDCQVTSDSDKSVKLFPNDQFGSDDSKIKTSIEITIVNVDKNKHVVAKYDQNELDTLEKAIKDGAFKQYLNMAEEVIRKNSARSAMQNVYSNSSRSTRNNYRTKPSQKADNTQKLIDELRQKSKVMPAYYSKLGKHKAHTVDYKVGIVNIRRFVVMMLNYLYVVEVVYSDENDITKTSTYEDFVKTFKANDKAPTWINHYMSNIVEVFLGILAIVFFSIIKGKASKNN